MTNAHCWGLWYGGSSYASPSREDTEEFESIEHAEEVFDDRYHNRLEPSTPCVDKYTTEMWVFYIDPRTIEGDLYPDEIIEYGSRGEIIREYA